MPLDQLDPTDTADRRFVAWAQTSIVLLFCAWILLLPVFPSQDGPIHLLYTAVLRSLLSPHGSHLAGYYTVKHVLPPYSLYYYLLMGLGSVVPLALADRLVVCLYVISFSFGLRYLAKPIGPSGDAMALLATPLLFNWALLTGLTSFLLSTTLVFWAAGLWSRADAMRSTAAPRVGFGVLLFLITLTHPVPLLLLGGFCVLELTLRLLAVGRRGLAARTARQRPGPALRSDLSLLLGFVVALAYVAHFAGGHSGTPAAHPGLLAHVKETVVFELQLASILPFRGGSALLLRLVWLLSLAGAVALLVRHLRRANRLAEPVTSCGLAWSGMSLFFLLGLPFIPDDVGGGHNFAYRMMIYLWLTAFAAAGMSSWRPGLVRRAAMGLSLLLTALTLFLAQRSIRPLAVEIAAAPALPAQLHGQAGVQLSSPGYRETRVALRNRLSFDPFQWAAANLFRGSDAVLLDSPWLEEGVLPLGSQPALPAAHLPPAAVEDDRRLREELLQSPRSEQDRHLLFDRAAFAVVVNGLDALPTSPDPLLAGWSCAPQRWYSLCLPPGDRAAEAGSRVADAATTPERR